MSNTSKIIRSNNKYYTINSNGTGSIFKYGINFYNKQQINYTSLLAFVPFFLSMEMEVNESSDDTQKRVYCCINHECSVYENAQACIDAGGIVQQNVPDTFDFNLDDLIVPQYPVVTSWLNKYIISIDLRNATTAVDKLQFNNGILITQEPTITHILTVKDGVDPISFGPWKQTGKGLIFLDSVSNKYYIAVNQKQSSTAINKYGLLEIIIVDNKDGGECTASQIDECDKTIIIPTPTPSVQLYDIPN